MMFSGIIAISLASIFISCNNVKTEQPSPKDDKVQKKDTVLTATSTIGNYPVLCIDKNDLETLFSDPSGGVQKLVFLPNLNDGEPNNPSLTVFRARQNGTFVGGAQSTLIRRTTTFPIPGEIIWGNLEMNRTKFTALWALPGRSAATHLLFFPSRSTTYNTNLTYKLLWGNCNAIPIINEADILNNPDELNPSPPFDPGQ